MEEEWSVLNKYQESNPETPSVDSGRSNKKYTGN